MRMPHISHRLYVCPLHICICVYSVVSGPIDQPHSPRPMKSAQPFVFEALGMHVCDWHST